MYLTICTRYRSLSSNLRIRGGRLQVDPLGKSHHPGHCFCFCFCLCACTMYFLTRVATSLGGAAQGRQAGAGHVLISGRIYLT
jgi:hypothetical protein